MSRDEIATILERVSRWPESRQEEAARMLLSMEEQDRSTLRLSPEHEAEVRRRMADPNPETVSAAEVFERFRRGG